MKFRLRLYRARPYFYLISDHPNVRFENFDFSVYTPLTSLKDDYHKKRNNMLAYTPAEFNFLATLAKIFIISARQNHFLYENTFNNAQVRRSAIAMKTNSSFTGSYSENPFWYQPFNVRQTKIVGGGQLDVDLDAADNSYLYVTKKKALNFQDEIPSIPLDIFKDHYALMFELTSMRDATENFH